MDEELSFREIPEGLSMSTDLSEPLRRIAAGIFAQPGVNFATAQQAGRWTNFTWRQVVFFLWMDVRLGSDKIAKQLNLGWSWVCCLTYPGFIEMIPGYKLCTDRLIWI